MFIGTKVFCTLWSRDNESFKIWYVAIFINKGIVAPLINRELCFSEKKQLYNLDFKIHKSVH